MSEQADKKHIVVIGGGTGSHTVLKGLKRFHDAIDITAIISMADSGGSTGRLRDEFGYLPVGDVRMALAALAKDDSNQEALLRRLFMHRFEKGVGLTGHNLGNLLLVALTDLLGSEEQAVTQAAKILQVCGTVIPVTTDSVHLQAVYDDGVVVMGESKIDAPAPDRFDHTITKLSAEPSGTISTSAATAIQSADLLVIGPGDLYSSLLANVVVGGVAAAIQSTKSKLVFVTNLMERPGQTRGMSQSQIVGELCRYIGRCPDVVCVNDFELPTDALARYKEQGDQPIIDDTDKLDTLVIKRSLVSQQIEIQSAADTLERSLIRHDSAKLAALLLELVE